MIKHDLFKGLLLGVIVGLMFTASLAPHLALITVFAVVVYSGLLDIIK